MDEDRFEELLREIAPDYHRPGETPRRAMQLRLQHVRATRKTQAIPRRKLLPFLWTGLVSFFRPRGRAVREDDEHHPPPDGPDER